MNVRIEALRQWVANRHHLSPDTLALDVIADDASFRRYFRLSLPDGHTRVLMDAPPEHEDCRAFLAIASQWRQNGLSVPAIHAFDLAQGFIELQDLGDVMLRQCLYDEHGQKRSHQVASTTVDDWMQRAMALAADIAGQDSAELAVLDAEWLGREMDLFPEWCLAWLSLETPNEWPALRQALIDAMLRQPQATVHRDFHPQNLMCHDEALWIIDFQGAVRGPLGYDPASLLRDRNPAWPLSDQTRWIACWHRHAEQRGLIASTSSATVHHWVNVCATQRSLKVLGLFCRLAQRDGKPRYLNMLRWFAEHVRQGLAGQQADGFLYWFEQRFMPRLDAQLARGARRESTP